MSILITGATGFLGKQLIALLAERHERILLLVRHKEAVATHFAGTFFYKKLIPLSGDLYQFSLGINDTTWQLYKDDITEIWHCAANLSFSPGDREQVMKCNLEGTIKMIEKAKECPRLQRFYYVSTAFVHGDSNDLIKEDELLPEHNIRFLNYYEESKYRAEKELRQSGLPFCIFRPAIIMGHSITGETGSIATYFGFYKALKLAFSNGRHIPQHGEPLRIEGINGLRNHICVDHITKMMNEIALSGKDTGKTFHLAYADQGRVSDIFSAINRCLGSNYILVPELKKNSLNLTEVLARKFSSDYHPYIMRHDPVLDRSNTLSVLKTDISVEEPFDKFLYRMYKTHKEVIVSVFSGEVLGRDLTR